MDEKDRRILNIIIEDSRLSYRRIARKSGLSAATVINRVMRMRTEGIIRKYSASIDYDKLGYGMHVFIEVRVSKGRLLDSEEMIAKNPHVYAVYDVTGGSDTLVMARFKNTKQLDNFVKSLQKMPNIIRTHTRLILNTIKEDKTTL